MITYCPDCKTEISHTAKVCPHCGARKRWQWRAQARKAVISSALEGSNGSKRSPIVIGGLALIAAIVLAPFIIGYFVK